MRSQPLHAHSRSIPRPMANVLVNQCVRLLFSISSKNMRTGGRGKRSCAARPFRRTFLLQLSKSIRTTSQSFPTKLRRTHWVPRRFDHPLSLTRWDDATARAASARSPSLGCFLRLRRTASKRRVSDLFFFPSFPLRSDSSTSTPSFGRVWMVRARAFARHLPGRVRRSEEEGFVAWMQPSFPFAPGAVDSDPGAELSVKRGRV